MLLGSKLIEDMLKNPYPLLGESWRTQEIFIAHRGAKSTEDLSFIPTLQWLSLKAFPVALFVVGNCKLLNI